MQAQLASTDFRNMEVYHARKRPERLTLIAFIISTILGGNNAIAVRFSNMELPPFFGRRDPFCGSIASSFS
jgi:hypothetical protein